jgi:hypothetical protein
MRRPGVLPNTYRAPMRPRLIGVPQFPASYSRIVGTPICLGENDRFGDCVTVAAFNAAATANARRGIFTPFADIEPFDLYVRLGGMPADQGLDPATLFNYWLSTPIGGYRLGGIHEIALTDISGIKQTIIDTGFAFFTADLDEAQMTQEEWVPADSPEEGGHATILVSWNADRFDDATWGAEREVSPEFIAKQGMNCWRLELVQA